MDEQWRPVLGFEDYYEVSDQGRVRSLARTCYGGPIAGERKVLPRILHQFRSGIGRDGKPRRYLAANLNRDGVGQRRDIHILVLEAFVGPRPPGCQVRHLDGTPNNNRLSNLAWGSIAENCADSLAHGTRALGGQKRNAKLCEDDIPRIRAARGAGASWRLLARDHGVSVACIRQIFYRRSWTHVSS